MLQNFFGPIKRISGKGIGAAHVKKLFTNAVKTSQTNASFNYHFKSQIDQVILLDRNIDLISAVATQLTHAGLVDELWGLNNCE